LSLSKLGSKALAFVLLHFLTYWLFRSVFKDQ
ncbi:hypothetical protein SAMN05421734_10986, partial [Pelagirhabdus alkalitolerans]